MKFTEEELREKLLKHHWSHASTDMEHMYCCGYEDALKEVGEYLKQRYGRGTDSKLQDDIEALCEGRMP
uniref:Uncharacterized protein n=1 Tax=viral metagenome TaxID=1070528 RepID=A0A6M3KB41_9ZZZZ